MTFIATFLTLSAASLGQALRSVHALLRASMPAPVLMPVPIRIDRHTRDVVDRPSRCRP